MDTSGYCKLCGQIKRHFCCQTCYEADATKSESKKEMSRTIADLEAQAIAQARTIEQQAVIIREHQAADCIAVEAIRSQAKQITELRAALDKITKTAVTLGNSQSAWEQWRICGKIANQALGRG